MNLNVGSCQKKILKNIEICVGASGVISTGEFENEKPFFNIKETLEIKENEIFTDKNIKERINELRKICYEGLKDCERQTILHRIDKTFKDLKFYSLSY